MIRDRQKRHHDAAGFAADHVQLVVGEHRRVDRMRNQDRHAGLGELAKLLEAALVDRAAVDAHKDRIARQAPSAVPVSNSSHDSADSRNCQRQAIDPRFTDVADQARFGPVRLLSCTSERSRRFVKSKQGESHGGLVASERARGSSRHRPRCSKQKPPVHTGCTGGLLGFEI